MGAERLRAGSQHGPGLVRDFFPAADSLSPCLTWGEVKSPQGHLLRARFLRYHLVVRTSTYDCWGNVQSIVGLMSSFGSQRERQAEDEESRNKHSSAETVSSPDSLTNEVEWAQLG